MTVNGKTLFFLMLLSVESRGQEGAFNGEKTFSLPDSYQIGWMQTLEDHKFISDVTVPGTHDTMALYGGPAAECQAWTLMEQLKAGIRYLDLRVFAFEKKLYIMHGVMYEHTSFPEVLHTIQTFLSEFPSETVFVRIKPDLSDKRSVQGLVQNLLGNDSNVWVKSEIPTIGDVRGKIVFVQKGDFTLGVPLLETDTSGDYKVTHVTQKEAEVQRHLSAAGTDCAGASLVLTYSSGTGVGTLGGIFLTPRRIAKEIDPWLYGYLEEMWSANSKLCLGIIAMDFPGFDLIQMVIKFNQK